MAKEFKPLDDDFSAPAKPVDLKAIKPVQGDDERADAIAEELSAKHRANRVVKPKVQKTEFVSVRIDIPDYTDKAIKKAGVKDGVSRTYIILKALKDAGLPVHDEDLSPDRRRKPGKRAPK